MKRTIDNEINNRKLERWEKKKYKALSIFPLRIQRKLLDLTFAVEIPVEWDGIYICGQVETGKTMLACKIVYERMKRNFLNNIFESMLFVSAEDFIQQVKNTYHTDKTETEGQILDKYKSVDVLILDDVGVKKTTDWSYSVYYQLINYRYDNMKPTIYTSNVSPEELADEMKDDRIARRINESCTKVITLYI